MLDDSRYGWNVAKLHHLCRGWYVCSTSRKYQLRFDCHYNWNSNANHTTWLDFWPPFHLRSLGFVETAITRRSFPWRISCLFLPIMRFQLSKTSIYPCKQKNNIGRLTANRWMVGNPFNLLPYTAGFLMSRMCKLAVTYSILTWS